MKKYRKGFTLTELIIGTVAAGVLVLSIGIALVMAQRGYSHTYEKVYGAVANASHVNTRLFDSIIRKSSLSAKEPEVGEDSDTLDVFSYETVSSVAPDKYASFYIEDEELKVDYGDLDANGNKLSADSTVTVAKHVENVVFTIEGCSVKMVLNLNDGSNQMTVTCSGVRHAR